MAEKYKGKDKKNPKQQSQKNYIKSDTTFDITTLWRDYTNGQNYNRRIDPDLYNTVTLNEYMYAGSQWKGVKSNGLPTPVFNIIKRIVNYQIAAIMSQKITFKFSAEYVPDEGRNEDELALSTAVDTLTNFSETAKERLKFEQTLRNILLDAALSGDGCIYNFFNPQIDLGEQDSEGAIEMQTIDNTNIFFGNPQDRRVNYNGRPIQPYIVVAFRETVVNLRREAKYNGVEESEIEKITSDEDNIYTSGERGRIELDNSTGNDGMTTAILKMWFDPETKTIKAAKATKFVFVKEEFDTKLSLYPIDWMNWDVRKNSYHGQAVVTGLVPNQIYINKMFAMVMLYMQSMAFPKVVYDKTRIQSISNQVGASIGVDGSVIGAIDVQSPGAMNAEVLRTVDSTIKYTKDMLGATDASLGTVRPDNTSAIIVLTQQASIPLESIKANLYQLVEDMAYNWLDIMVNYYGERMITYNVDGVKMVETFDFSKLKGKKINIKVDVGASSYWSESAALQTLDNLLQADKITFLQYLDRLPQGIMPKKSQMMDDEKARMDAEAQAADAEAQMASQVGAVPTGIPQGQVVEQPQGNMPQKTPQLEQPQGGADDYEFDQMKAFLDTLPMEIQEKLVNMDKDEMSRNLLGMMQMEAQELSEHVNKLARG